jgi:hypothetical protein
MHPRTPLLSNNLYMLCFRPSKIFTCKSTDECMSVSFIPIIVSTLPEILNFQVQISGTFKGGPIKKIINFM